MPKFTSHIFVCGNQRPPDSPRGCCDPEGNEELCRLLRAELKRHDVGPLVRANKSGCLDQCEHGPTVVIYPQEIWYGGVTAADIPRIVEQTIVGGRILSDLLIPDDQLNRKAMLKGSQPSAGAVPGEEK
jgi:(2Fe-2S) ferredoxin